MSSSSNTSPYADRPWRRLYPAGLGDLDPEQPAVLDQLSVRSGLAPSSPAVHYFGNTLTWQDIENLSSVFASALIDRGHGGGRVALYMQNMPEFVIATVGAWKAGAAVVPINPMLKALELEHIIGDSRSTVLIGLDELLTDPIIEVARTNGVKLLLHVSARDLAGDHPLVTALPSESRASAATDSFVELCTADRPTHAYVVPSDCPAFITYTSGTTGRPKGAVNTHANVAFNSVAKQSWMNVNEDDVILGVAPLFHITGLVAHLALSIVSGAPLVLGFRFDPSVMLRLIEERRPTFAIGAITAFLALLDHPERPTTDLSSLTKVFSGGAPVSPAVAARFQREIGPYVHNAYGLTETTAATHVVPLGMTAPIDPVSGALSIGVPYSNTDVRVVDDDGNDLAVSEIGELVVSGPQVAKGYWGRPEETAATFTSSGFRTGDVGFMDADGWFYLVDRRKDMIVASGYKVWPREVEDVLYQHPAVREAAVIGAPDAYRGETVKAFISLMPGAVVDQAEVISFCRERLANYKSPRIIEVLPELPKTASGKILRRTLRDPSSTRY